MKIKLLVAVVALLSAATIRAQMFDAGYTFQYYFPALPSYQAIAIIPETGFYLSPYSTATATIRWEIFDSLPTGAPVHSGVWQPGDSLYAGLFDQTWHDGEGSFRFTILSGSQLIRDCLVYVARPNGPDAGFTVYSAQLPAAVPEPAAVALLGLGVAALVVFARRARRI